MVGADDIACHPALTCAGIASNFKNSYFDFRSQMGIGAICLELIRVLQINLGILNWDTETLQLSNWCIHSIWFLRIINIPAQFMLASLTSLYVCNFNCNDVGNFTYCLNRLSLCRILLKLSRMLRKIWTKKRTCHQSDATPYGKLSACASKKRMLNIFAGLGFLGGHIEKVKSVAETAAAGSKVTAACRRHMGHSCTTSNI